MTEKEVAYKVKDFKGLFNFLKRLDNSFKTRIIIYWYFESSVNKKFYTRIEKIVLPSQKTPHYYLTYKYGFENKNGVDVRQERTIEISDPKFYIEFFNIAGLIPLGIKHKKQYIFKINDLEVTLNDWKEIPPTVEVEGKSMNNIKKFADELIKYCI